MNHSKLATLLCLGLLISACAEPTVDTSSKEKIRASVEKVKQSLTETQQKEFTEAVVYLTVRQINIKDIFKKGGVDKIDMPTKVGRAIHGKTGKEIIAAALNLKKEKLSKQITSLEDAKKQADSAQATLKRFEVTNAKFYKKKQRYGRPKPYIKITVKNGTDQAVSRVYFHGRLISTDRAVPWLVENFNYGIPGGIEPGEKKIWNLAPNPYSKWGAVESPRKAKLEVSVLALEGVDEKKFADASGYTKKEADKLTKLKSELAELQ